MSLRNRVTLAVVLTAALLGGMTAYTVTRLRHWNRIGLAGLTFFPDLPSSKRPALELFSPGRVFMAVPTAPAESAGIRGGDVVLSVNGIPIKENDKLIARARQMHTGDVAVYRIRRDKKILEFRVPLQSPLHVPVLLASTIVSSLVATAYIAIALLVLSKRPDDRRVLVFYAMMAVGAVYLVGTPALTLDSSNFRGLYAEVTGQGLVPLMALMAAFVAFLPLTLHLALIFPRERPIMRTSPHVLRWVYGVPAAFVITLCFLISFTAAATGGGEAAIRRLKLPLNVLFALITLTGLVMAWRIVRQSRGERLRLAFWRRPIQSIFIVIGSLLGFARVADAIDIGWLEFTSGLILGITPVLAMASFPILSCLALYRSYRDAGPEERRQVKWPLWGTITALATRIIINAIGEGGALYFILTGGDFNRWVGYAQISSIVAMLVYLLIPISFAQAILKHRLMNIDIIIRKTVVYAMLSGAIIVVYLAIVGVLGTILVNVVGVRSQTMVIGATLVVALVFVPMRNKLQTMVERNLFRHKYDYADGLRAISAETLAAHDLGTFLTSAAEKMQHALQNRSVVVFAGRHEEFIAVAKVGVADSLLGALRIAQQPVTPMLDRPFDPRRHALPEDAASALKRIEASLVVPVNTPGTPPNGFIALAPKLSGAEFDVEDIDFLRSVADQLDIGFDRIRLQREDADYSQARTIQQSLLPREMPLVGGLEVSGIWLPARAMGGDYFDVLKLSETELAICIGDVAGKGMPAALLMSGLQAAVRASASSSPRDLCERVRRVVVSSLSGGRFVTFFYAMLDMAAMRLRWTNAGHNAPILARADGTILRLDEGGPAISRLFKDAYAEREIALQPGDRIVLFTDGVSEATDPRGEQFGEQRIEELVLATRDASAEELQRTIVDAASSFAAGEVEDDVTLVVVKVSS